MVGGATGLANPQQQLRDWQRRLFQECHNIERQIRDVQREKGVEKAIKEAAKRNDMGSAKVSVKMPQWTNIVAVSMPRLNVLIFFICKEAKDTFVQIDHTLGYIVH
ncbi:vacuolar protein sorting-associated protein 24 homolog 1-like [Humulus lupulus]|uniref:vacuolar protein sorting-associated protein 24 homolog 1-like n=1 Tax=Humulus lupulus TaxID=3486 RepID=UPI002B4025A0|nr:vacuolar protein sorting-associated protein 24 homolog 1-like [Humulus lupulus]XP_062116278.1 vacuolar protein sorting-associated protein 24 homolog 1-like [Humulus lupulus]XP_062116279.1 vacuolar protein sorting-associated protein 24 homolog 1-like [Humulus lupulus]XP_062116280.1 vacuolar protein sorting-associated protein 24 homolog 1-like [Humulus lupulus]XP_062116281.1 vacuolar protein sorting-associated protein 24 homolog 1-like [Humulus lupulus]